MTLFNPTLAGIKLHYPTTEKECWSLVDGLIKCHNCINYTPKSLFEGECDFPDGDDDRFDVSCDNCCECFFARDNRVRYWKNKLVCIAHYLGGHHDEMKAWMIENGIYDKMGGYG